MCINYLLTYLQVTQARPMNPRKYASMFTLRNGILFKLSLEFFRLRVRPFIPIHILAIHPLRNVKKFTHLRRLTVGAWANCGITNMGKNRCNSLLQMNVNLTPPVIPNKLDTMLKDILVKILRADASQPLGEKWASVRLAKARHFRCLKMTPWLSALKILSATGLSWISRFL